MVYICIILVDFGFWCLVVTYFDFWWSQRLFSEKAVGKRVVGSGSVTKLAIDQLKPRRSSLSATSVQCKQAIHCNSLLFCTFHVIVHCIFCVRYHFALRWRVRTQCTFHFVYHISYCTVHIGHWSLHCGHWALEFALCTLDIALCTALARQSTG